MSTVKFDCPDGCPKKVALKNDGTPYKHICIRPTVGRCDDCGQNVPLREDGTRGFHLRDLSDSDSVCRPAAEISEPQQCSEPSASNADVAPQFEPCPDGCCEQLVSPDQKGPWFGAVEADRCSVNECTISGGDRIRADGEGGYECEDCGDFDDGMDRHVRVSLGIEADTDPVVVSSALESSDWQEQASATVVPTPKAVLLPSGRAAIVVGKQTPDDFMDEFDDPTPAAPKLNVSGQPDARRDWLGRYIVIDPELGDFRRTAKGRPVGLTRVTTFVKEASSSIALGDWQKRNVLIGAVRRPDVVRQAHNLTHERDRDTLQRLVGQLEDAAGAKVSADEGTFLHEFTEHMDAGLETWQDAAPQYRQSLRRYADALSMYGLEPVPGLIERTVMVKEFGGIVGTFDRVFFHRPSGTYLIGDLKTGKTLKYGYSEIEAQEWLYAHGINQGGVYDWNTDAWTPTFADAGPGHRMAPHVKVREDVGVIIHMPVQGPDAGKVLVRKADLVAGKAYAELCDDVRSHPKAKVKEWDGWWEDPEPTWEERFAAVWDKAEATQLWRLAKDRGITAPRLDELVQIARDALADKG